MILDGTGGLRLEKGFWRQRGSTVYACFDLAKETSLRVDFGP